MELFDSLADETSKRALCFYVESFVKNCIYRSEQNPTRWKYFFGGKYERLYNFAAMLKNLSLLPPDKRALVESINQMIDEQTDFEKILAGNKCTLLNADIEGAELKLLHATEKIIRTDRPVMATANRFFMPCPSSAVVVRDKKISNDIMAARNLAA